MQITLAQEISFRSDRLGKESSLIGSWGGRIIYVKLIWTSVEGIHLEKRSCKGGEST